MKGFYSAYPVALFFSVQIEASATAGQVLSPYDDEANLFYV